jgi:hypothetical protein
MGIWGGSLGDEGEGHIQPPNSFPLEVGGAWGGEYFCGGVENTYEKEGLSDVESDGGDLDNWGWHQICLS